MARESSLWNWLAKARRVLGDELLMTRIENVVSAGMPDVEGVFRGRQFWFELKSIERPLRSSTKLRFKIRDAQIAWLSQRWLCGGNALFLLQVGSGSERILYLAPGYLGSRLASGMTESELATECMAAGIFKQQILFRNLFQQAISRRTHEAAA